jgi:hypothetical protein
MAVLLLGECVQGPEIAKADAKYSQQTSPGAPISDVVPTVAGRAFLGMDRLQNVLPVAVLLGLWTCTASTGRGDRRMRWSGRSTGVNAGYCPTGW